MKIELTVPKGWSELTHSNLEYFSRLLLAGVNEVELLTRCFIQFSGLKLLHKDPTLIDDQLYYLFKYQKGSRFLLDVDRFAAMVSKIDYLVKEVHFFQNPERIGRYSGCNSMLYGVSLGEYLVADSYYSDYSLTHNEQSLDNMLAIFYRDRSESWDEGHNLEKWTRRFKRIPLHRKYIVYLWYTGVKAWLIDKYPYIFSGEANSQLSTPADEVVMGMLSSLNDGDITHNPQIKATEVHEVLFELNKRIETSQSI